MSSEARATTKAESTGNFEPRQSNVDARASESAPAMPSETRQGHAALDETGMASVRGRRSKRDSPVAQRAPAVAAPSSPHASPRNAGVASPQTLGAPRAAGARSSEIRRAGVEELRLAPRTSEAVISSWTAFLDASASQDAAGEAIFTALFESAPSMQSLFTSPRTLHAGKFVNAIISIMAVLNYPTQLKAVAEQIAFAHMDMDVSMSRVAIFRDSITNLLRLELGDGFSPEAHEGWDDVLNYIGATMNFVQSHYAERLALIAESWAIAKSNNAASGSFSNDKAAGSEGSSGSSDLGQGKQTRTRMEWGRWRWGRRAKQLQGSVEPGQVDGSAEAASSNAEQQHREAGGNAGNLIPTTFQEMFQFNAVVMGFAENFWLMEVVACFDNIVRNMSNSARVKEECDVLVLRISRCTHGEVDSSVHLPEFKACMLAALRSLLPKDWSPAHEVAWSWLWEVVERILEQTISKPALWKRRLSEFKSSLEPDKEYELRKEVYARFFTVAPTGQDYFKQSNTRLHYIMQRILSMTTEFYEEPMKMVDELSALGLRHVGYGIPTELFGPFVSVCMEVFKRYCADPVALEAFSWSLGLIAKILTRTILEGSTIVMKAINRNSPRQLKKALSCAPRGARAQWLLCVQVGSQSISPLSWAIESGSLEAAKAIIDDLLTIRADRERYYYGVDELFNRHPDIVKIICNGAPTLLPALLQGLTWRSRNSKNGIRQANYYVKHLLINPDGQLSDALRYIVASKDLLIIAHPVIALVSDTFWKGLVRRYFLFRRVGFLLDLLIFTLCQSILPLYVEDGDGNKPMRIMVFVGRLINYIFCLGGLTKSHITRAFNALMIGRVHRVLRIPVPKYLRGWYDGLSLVLAILLLLMALSEPMFYCFGDSEWPTYSCDKASQVEFRYSLLSMTAIGFHWMLIIDMAVFSTKLSAFILVCAHVLSELYRFFVALLFLLLTFGSAVSSLSHNHKEFKDVPNSMLSLFALTVNMFPYDYRILQGDPALLVVIYLFVACSAILLLNLLIAQLNCSYEFVYQDSQGFARLNRAAVIVDTLSMVPENRWRKFVGTLRLDQPLDFNEGDVGLAGGIRVNESASQHAVVEENIIRFGGTCSPDMKWPDETTERGYDGIDRIESMLLKAMKQMKVKSRRRGGDGEGGGSVQGSGHSQQDAASTASSDGNK